MLSMYTVPPVSYTHLDVYKRQVRYIAMNDGIDTMRDNNDIAPFKNILNEMYSKDISKKVHSAYLLKAQQGQFTGCVAPFGSVSYTHLRADLEIPVNSDNSSRFKPLSLRSSQRRSCMLVAPFMGARSFPVV